MILSVRINPWAGKYKDLTPEQWAELRAAVPQLPEEKPDSYYSTLTVDDDGIRAMAKAGLSIDLEDDPNCNTMLVKLQDRLEQLGGRCDDLSKLCVEGAAVQIAIPDFGLLLITEVDYLDNACTDTVQGRLDEGWRILAVCPPNAQRRPDYIIGRRKVEA